MGWIKSRQDIRTIKERERPSVPSAGTPPPPVDTARDGTGKVPSYADHERQALKSKIHDQLLDELDLSILESLNSNASPPDTFTSHFEMNT